MCSLGNFFFPLHRSLISFFYVYIILTGQKIKYAKPVPSLFSRKKKAFHKIYTKHIVINVYTYTLAKSLTGTFIVQVHIIIKRSSVPVWPLNARLHVAFNPTLTQYLCHADQTIITTKKMSMAATGRVIKPVHIRKVLARLWLAVRVFHFLRMSFHYEFIDTVIGSCLINVFSACCIRTAERLPANSSHMY